MSDYTEHARLSPSGSKKWMACAGSLVMEEQVPAKPNDAADKGTCCHIISARCLTEHWPPTKYIGEDVKVSAAGEEDRFVEFDDDLCDLVLVYLRQARQYTIGPRKTYWVEERVSFSRYVDVPNQFGTSDLIVYDADPDQLELQIHDAKFGHRPVLVEGNSQLLTYALGAYDMLCLAYDIQRIRIVVHQPQVYNGPAEWTVTVQDLLDFGKRLWDRAQMVELATQQWQPIVLGKAEPNALADWHAKFLNPKPNEDECAYCRAMAICPAAQRVIEETVGASFDVVIESKEPAKNFVSAPGPRLDQQMQFAGFLEDMVTAIRSRMEGHLLGGGVSTTHGLELGRQGIRRWDDPEAVKKVLRENMRLTIEETFNLKLKSPTQLEKMAGLAGKTATNSQSKDGNPRKRGRPKTVDPTAPKPVIGPQQWDNLRKMIVRNPPKPSVKPLAVIKVPYSVAAMTGDSFQPVVEDDDDLS